MSVVFIPKRLKIEETDGNPSNFINKLVVPNNSLTISGGDATLDITSGIIVREVDSDPLATITTLIFPNGTVTILGDVATITGLQGPPGIQGIPGNTGPAGETGATGAAGPNLVSTATATNITGPLVGNGSTIIAGSFGTAAGTFCEGNDSRLSDARTPTAHSTDLLTSGTLPVARGGTGLASLGTATHVLRVNAGGTALEFAAPLGGSTGATDNGILRSDGTGGSTLQNSAVTIDDSGNVTGVAALTASGTLITNGGTAALPSGTTSNQLIGNTLVQGRLRVHTNNSISNATTAWDFINYGDQHLMSPAASRICQSITQDGVATAHYGFAANSNVFVIGSDGAAITFRSSPTATLAAGTERFNFNLSNGNLTASGTLQVGGGTVVANILSATATLDFGSIGSNATETLTITVTGAVAGDSVFLGCPAGLDAGLIFCASVTAADTVTVRMHNSTGGSVDPASGTFRATVIRF
jgi:hypothetical protein